MRPCHTTAGGLARIRTAASISGRNPRPGSSLSIMDRLPNARDQRVSVLQTDDYVAVSPHTPLSQAIEAMKDDEGGCVIVADGGRVAGIFTERDLLTKVLGESPDLESPISEWMQPNVETLS